MIRTSEKSTIAIVLGSALILLAPTARGDLLERFTFGWHTV